MQVIDKECYDFLMPPKYFFQFINQISPKIQVYSSKLVKRRVIKGIFLRKGAIWGDNLVSNICLLMLLS